MKRHISTIIAAALSLSAQSQVLPRDTSLNAYTTGQTSIQALGSITLKNGFHIPVQPSGKSVTISIVGFQNLLSQPSPGQNYILTKIFKKPGVTLATLNSQRTIGEENQTIQYFDGLGRPLQTVQLMASPSYKDIVQHIEYDGFGRESTKYLPYAHSRGNGSYKTGGKDSVVNFYNKTAGADIAGVVRTDKPFAVTVFENSPLNRMQEQGAPGAAWQPLAAAGTGHTVKTTYGTNAATGLDVVKLWTVTANGATGTANYAAGKLYRTTLRDENTVNTTARAGSTDEYKDFEGRVVLKRIWETESKALNTCYVYDDFGDLRYVLPPAVTAASFTELAADPNFEKYIYAYKYDERRRLTNKKIPGKGWEYLVYNKNDQLVLSQDSLQRARNEWIYNRYDAFGRITSTGLYTNTVKSTLSDVQALVNAATGPLWETRVGADYPAIATTFPLAGTGITIKPHVINYYDDYTFTGATTLAASITTQSQKVRSLQTGSKVYKIDGTLPLLTVLYYDDYGRVIQTASANHLEGKDYVTNIYSFVGELETSTRVHTPKTGTATTIVTKNEYDHVGRLIATKERIGSQAEVILASNSYNEIGQLKSTALGKAETETTFINTSTFSYNERGWLTKSSSPKFSQQLKYQDGTNPQWNGNISQQLWGDDATLPNTFSYSYDKLNRLLSGVSTPTGTSSMSEIMTYDDMGNVKTLKRDALVVTTYAYNGNKLTGLTGGLTGAYTYDGNGNATKDRTGMLFSYNYLNLPQSASKTGTSVTYLYDAIGTKLQKKSTVGTINSSRDYIDGIEYNGTVIDIIHNSVGYALKSGTNYVYHYNLADHLGNVRATLKRGSTATAVDVTQRDNYYPFGKQKVVAGGNNKYLYNGKEIQGELGGQYDYGARFYDAEIGRWNVIDRFASKYSNISPYSYAGLDPIKNIDINGDSIWITSSEPIRKGNDIIQNHTINITGKVLKAGMSYTTSDQLASALTTRLNSQKGSTSAVNSLGGSSIDNYSISAKFEGVDNMFSVKSGDHLVVMVDRVLGEGDAKLGGGEAVGMAMIGGLVSYVEIGTFSSMTATAFHEIGHSLGLKHPESNSVKDPMSYTGQNANFSGQQLREVTGNNVNIGPNKSFIINKTPNTRNYSTDKMPYIGPRSYMMRIPYPTQN
ncbi:DUF6443 domain-containing protein [Sphingobacterium faecium]